MRRVSKADAVFNDDWYEPELMAFPSVTPLIESQRLKSRQIYKELVKEHVRATERKSDQVLRDFDVEINLKALMDSDLKYKAMKRNKKKMTSDYFSPVIMNKIVHDAHLISKYKDDEEVCNSLSARINQNIVSYFNQDSGGDPCKRFVRHDLKFEKNRDQKLAPTSLSYQESYADRKKLMKRLEEVKLEYETMKKKYEQKFVKLPPITQKPASQNIKPKIVSRLDEQQEEQVSEYNEAVDRGELSIYSPVYLKFDDHDEQTISSVEINVLKPKNQEVTLTSLKNV